MPLDKVHDMWQGQHSSCLYYTYVVTMTMTYMASYIHTYMYIYNYSFWLTDRILSVSSLLLNQKTETEIETEKIAELLRALSRCELCVSARTFATTTMTRLERDAVRERQRQKERDRDRESIYCELGLGSGPRTESVQIHRLNLHLGTKQIHTHTHTYTHAQTVELRWSGKVKKGGAR